MNASCAKSSSPRSIERELSQGRNPRALSELDLSRARRLGRRDGGARLFWKAGRRRSARSKARCSPVSPRARTISAPIAIPDARASASLTCLAACRTTACSAPRRRRRSCRSSSPTTALRRDTGFHFVDQVTREAKSIAGHRGARHASSYTVRSTINPALQRATESILQEGLARYELNRPAASNSRAPEANIAEAVRLAAADPKGATEPAWLAALRRTRLPLYDVHWEPAVVLENGARQARRSRSMSDCSMAASCRSTPGPPRPRNALKVERCRLCAGARAKAASSPRAPSCACARPCRAPRL